MSENGRALDWAIEKNGRREMLRSLTGSMLNVSDTMCGRIRDMLEYLAFGCTEDGAETIARQNTIAKRFGVKRQTVNSWVKIAREKGLLRVADRFNHDGFRCSNKMECDWDKIKKISSNHGTTDVKKFDNGCKKNAHLMSKKLTTVSNLKPSNNYLNTNHMVSKKNDLDEVDKVGSDHDNIALKRKQSVDLLLEAERVTTIGRDPAMTIHPPNPKPRPNMRIMNLAFELMRSEFHLKLNPELMVCREVAKSIAIGVYDFVDLGYAVSETMKRREGSETPDTGFRRLEYVQAILNRRQEERVCK